MAKKEGLGPRGRSRIREDLASIGNNKGGSERKKVHAGTYVHDEAYNDDKHDLTPWSETPKSSRVSRYRYDHLNSAIQVQWRNNKNHGYIYLEVPAEGYRTFVVAASKGRHINSTLNNYEYRPMTTDEVSAPSNSQRGTATRTTK